MYLLTRVQICRFRDAPVEALRADVRLYSALQEHALRVMQVVEKVIGRLDQQEKARETEMAHPLRGTWDLAIMPKCLYLSRLG